MENLKLDKLNYKIKVIDNFLNPEDFKDLCNLEIEKETNKKFLTYHNEISDDKIVNSSIDKNLLKRIHRNYHSKAMEILNEINPEKVKLYDYSDFLIIITSKDSKFPIHDDTPNKLLSGVVYLEPEKNSGTKFYNNKVGENLTNIEWQPNRAVFFSRKERETWPSYEGDGKKNRVVLVYNLMTRRVKDVFKVEKKNYLIGNLRFKINPYLFRFFKITI